MSGKKLLIHILEKEGKLTQLNKIYNLFINSEYFNTKAKNEIGIKSIIRSRLSTNKHIFYSKIINNESYYDLVKNNNIENIIVNIDTINNIPISKNNKIIKQDINVLIANYFNNYKNDKTTYLFINIIKQYPDKIYYILINFLNNLPDNIEELSIKYNFTEELLLLKKHLKRIEQHKKCKNYIKCKKINQKYENYIHSFWNNDIDKMLYWIITLKIEDFIRWDDIVIDLTNKNLIPNNFNDLVKQADNYIEELDLK
jgi:hypothetical protein